MPKFIPAEIRLVSPDKKMLVSKKLPQPPSDFEEAFDFYLDEAPAILKRLLESARIYDEFADFYKDQAKQTLEIDLVEELFSHMKEGNSTLLFPPDCGQEEWTLSIH